MRLEGRLISGEAVRVHVDGDRIGGVEALPDAPDVLLVPGLVDLQVNGYAGFDVNGDGGPEPIVELTRALWRHGVTAFCPTVISAPENAILDRLRAIAAARNADPLVAASIAGVHVEGPYISPEDGARGAHDPAHLRDPNLGEFERWQRASGGLVRIVTLAPERPGAAGYISAVSATGVAVSIGHTMAGSREIAAAVGAGARLSTHLGNGVPARIPRHDNALWPQLAAAELTASFVGDGAHLPADAFTAMVRAKGVDRSVLITDSAALAGCPPGRYHTPVGGDVVVEPSGRLVVAGTGYLAGSGAALDECLAWVERATPFGLAEAVAMAAENPARILGRTGRLRPGEPANLAVLTPDLAVRSTIVAGRAVHG